MNSNLRSFRSDLSSALNPVRQSYRFCAMQAAGAALFALLWLGAGALPCPAQISYNFDDGTLQGWITVSSDPGNTPDPEKYAAVSAQAGVNPQGGTGKFVMCQPSGSRDNAHKPLWIRSPEFLINQPGNLTLWLAGGTGLGGWPGNLATLPANASQIPLGVDSTTSGVMGVALRDTATGDFVVSAQRIYSDPAWTNIVWDVSAYRNNGRTYTVELFDYHSGTPWSFLCLDTVTVPGSLACTLSYDANGGSGTAPGPYTQTVGTTIATAPAGTFTRASYAFTGWNTAADGSGTAYAPGTTFTFSVTTTLYAQWMGNMTYTLSYDANGGTGTAPGPYTQNSGTTITTAAAGTFIRADHVFTGWNTAADGSGTAYAPGATFNFAADTTLYAQWIPTYTLRYDANGGTGSAPGPYTQISGTTITTAGAVTFTRADHVFTGWNTAADGSGTAYAPGATFVFTANTTLYAQWLATTTISGMVTEGGAGVAGVTVSYGSRSSAATVADGAYIINNVPVGSTPKTLSVSGLAVNKVAAVPAAFAAPDQTPIAGKDILVQTGLGYDFEDGTLQGWTTVSDNPGSTTGPTNYASVGAQAGVSPREGTRFVMCQPSNLRDQAHQPLWIRSPEFVIDKPGNVSLWLAGGTGLAGWPGNLATLPANASEIPLGVDSTMSGVMGVALRDVATGDFVCTAQRIYSDASWTNIVWDVSAYRNNGKHYTVELFDYHSGNGWSFLCLDAVTIPGSLATSPSTPEFPVSGFRFVEGVPTFSIPNTIADKTYTLWYTDSLSGTPVWTPLTGTGTMVSPGGTIELSDPSSPVPADRFYTLGME